jgi:hypothetical protein
MICLDAPVIDIKISRIEYGQSKIEFIHKKGKTCLVFKKKLSVRDHFVSVNKLV